MAKTKHDWLEIAEKMFQICTHSLTKSEIWEVSQRAPNFQSPLYFTLTLASFWDEPIRNRDGCQ